MKNPQLITLWILFLVFSAKGQIVTIPDPIFKENLVNNPVVDTNEDGVGDSDADVNNDGEIQFSEAQAVIGLHLIEGLIYSLEGIEAFINLEKLTCQNQNISSIDLSDLLQLQEIKISHNELSNLNLSENYQLETISVSNNQLTQLILPETNSLLNLNCNNNKLSNIDLSDCISLVELYVNNNQLNEINVSNSLQLEQLSVVNNQLFEIDLTSNLNLDRLRISKNLLESLNLSNNHNLRLLNCSDNLLSHLDVSSNNALINLQCDKNQISSLDISQLKNIELLKCRDNYLEQLNISNFFNTELHTLLANNNSSLNCIQVDNSDYANQQKCNPENETGWCKDDWAIYSDDCLLGIETSNDSYVYISPNPVSTKFLINSNFNIQKLTIYNLHGIEVLKKEHPKFPLDFSMFSKGIYIFKIELKKGFYTQKIIKD